MYICRPTSVHRDFRYGYRRYKDNTFILETTLFGWKSMILRSDLTLSNMNMSKNSTFAWFFLLKSLYYQWLLVSLHRQFPPSLSTMLKCVGLFCFYGYMATRIPFIKTYSTPHELVQLLKTRGMEFWILDLNLYFSYLIRLTRISRIQTTSRLYSFCFYSPPSSQLSPAGRRRLNGSDSI